MDITAKLTEFEMNTACARYCRSTGQTFNGYTAVSAKVEVDPLTLKNTISILFVPDYDLEPEMIVL